MPRKKRDKPSCTACGLCCCLLQLQDAYCDLTNRDIERLPKKYHRHIKAIDVSRSWYFHKDYCGVVLALKTNHIARRAGPLKGVKDCRCILLRGEVLKKVHCAVYEERPETCRVSIKPGDRQCLELREMHLELIEREGEKAQKKEG